MAYLKSKTLHPAAKWFGGPDLHEAAEAEDGVGHPALLEEVFAGGLDAHEGHVGVLLAVVDAEEQVPLNAHGLQTACVMLGAASSGYDMGQGWDAEFKHNQKSTLGDVGLLACMQPQQDTCFHMSAWCQ